jgi:hypothetical protein
MNAAIGLRRLLFQTSEVTEDVDRIRPSANNIAQLHEVRVTGDPLSRLINRPDLAKCGEVIVKVPMHITHDQHTINGAKPESLRCRTRQP